MDRSGSHGGGGPDPFGGLMDALDPQTRVLEQSVSLVYQDGSVRGTLNIDALRDAEIPVENPPDDVLTLYHKQSGLLVFDLKGNFSDTGGEEREVSHNGK